MQFEMNLNGVAWKVAPWDDGAGVCPGSLTAAPAGAKTIPVPSMVQMAFPARHGVFVYFCEFEGPAVPAGHRALLTFSQADYYAQVWLNGKLLGDHEGPDVPFAFDVTDTVTAGTNRLAVRLINTEEIPHDGLTLYATPHRNKRMGWHAGSTLNCGGLNGHVSLSVLPAVYLTAMGTHTVADAEKQQLSVDATVYNPAGLTGGATLTAALAGERTLGQGTTALSFVLNGDTEQRVTLTVPAEKPHLWDIDDPYLYTVTLTLSTEKTEAMTISRRVGFKTFCVKDGWFTLNGRRIFLKCTHSGSIYPVGQMLPVLPEQVRRDFVLAKATGFNCVRAISGCFYPEQMDFCDEIGLLVYEEGQGGWCLGEQGAANAPDALSAILRRFDENAVGWILRDRNHACLALVGLLNETMGYDPVYLHAREFLGRVREVDTEHVVILGSGSWDQDPAQGRVSNPGGLVWETTWGDEGRGMQRTVTDRNYWDRRENGWITDIGYALGDIHPYVEAPISRDSENGLRTLFATPGTKPIFVSEAGVGPLFNVIEEWRHFEQLRLENVDAALEDVAWISSQAKSLIADWERLGLDKHSGYPFPEWMLRESQRYAARDRLDMFDCLRANPLVCGYSLTGMNDHGWCGEGLWSQFRRMKPENFDALEDGWADLRFCLFVPPYVFADKPFTVEAVLANAGVLSPGTYTADFALGGPCGIVERFSQDFIVTDRDGMAIPVVKKEIVLRAGGANEYTFYATLREGGAPMGRCKPFRVLSERELPNVGGTFASAGLTAAQTALLTARGAKLVPFTGDEVDLPVLLGDVDADLTARAIEAAKRGARVVCLCHNALRALADKGSLAAYGLPGDLAFINYEDWLYHKECVATDHPFMRGFAPGIVPIRYFGGAFPHWIFQTDATPDEVILPAFQTGFYKPEGAYALLWAMAGFNVGKGKIYLNTTELSRPDAVPAAAKLLCGIAAALV